MIWFLLGFGLIVSGAFGLVVYLLLFLRWPHIVFRENADPDSVGDFDKKWLKVDDN